MDPNIEYRVHPKETVYFLLMLLVSAGLYYGLVWLLMKAYHSESELKATVFVICFYGGLIILFLFFRFGLLIGYLKGNAVKLNKHQFPEIYQSVLKQSDQLGLRKAPHVFILQSGGLLNAFAARFLGRNYIVLYSEIVETALEQEPEILDFIIGHELGHIKRNHMLKRLIVIPAWVIPFLGSAYSRACEYTCDRIGHALSPAGTRGGLLVLASGRTLYKKVNLKAYLAQDQTEDGFWKWFAEKASSHPNLTRRLASFPFASEPDITAVKTQLVERKEEDHSRYMPH